MSKKDEPKSDAPKSVRAAEELQLENELLLEQLKNAEAKAKALEAAASVVKASESTGAKVARAKMSLLGDGRREVKPGMALNASELDGLTDGVHFEMV